MSHWDKCTKCGKYFDAGTARAYGNNLSCQCAWNEMVRHRELIDAIKNLQIKLEIAKSSIKT